MAKDVFVDPPRLASCELNVDIFQLQRTLIVSQLAGKTYDFSKFLATQGLQGSLHMADRIPNSFTPENRYQTVSPVRRNELRSKSTD